MTLIELAVVMTILIALSTLLIPYVANYLGRAETATSNYNATAAMNALQQYYATYGVYPNGLDILSDENDKVVQYLDDTPIVGKPFGATTQGSYVLSYSSNFGTMQDVSGSMTASLAKVGVTKTWRMKSGKIISKGDGTYCLTSDTKAATGNCANAFDATYASQGIEFPLKNDGSTTYMYVSDSCGGFYVEGNDNCLCNILGYRNANIDFGGNATHMLILLGINQNNAMITKTIANAPVHFPDTPNVNPSVVYSRFLAAFDVDMTPNCFKSAKGCDPAKLVAVVVGPDASKGWQTVTTGMARAFTSQ
jgi:type II secretory pathway pseudopilin PulG